MPPKPDQTQQDTQRFVTTVVDANQLWGLQSPEGDWAICDSIEYEDTEVYIFFSDQARAQKLCSDDWVKYKPAVISLDDFLNKWLGGMHDDEHLVGLNWDAELVGNELEPGDLAEAFAQLADNEDD